MALKKNGMVWGLLCCRIFYKYCICILVEFTKQVVFLNFNNIYGDIQYVPQPQFSKCFQYFKYFEKLSELKKHNSIAFALTRLPL